MYLYHCLNCNDEEIKKLARQIILKQNLCKHEFGEEWQEYNFYKKRCKKCAYEHSEEY